MVLQQTQHKLLQKSAVNRQENKQDSQQHTQLLKQISQLKNVICQVMKFSFLCIGLHENLCINY